jgi:DHA1 family bicyclomycin/chloramphenicol resistance-like MFS transporter
VNRETRAPVQRSRLALAALLAALAMVSPFSIDTFFPSFRAIAADLDVATWQVQQTLTVYLVPYGVMALVHGPLSDAFGRRPIVLGGVVLYALASLACALAPSFATLLVFRALQGMTAGAGLVVGRAIVRDLYDGPHAQRLMSMVMLIFGIAPAVAPILGGWIHVYFGWRAVFGFMVLIGVALLAACHFALPETHPRERRIAFHASNVLDTAWRIASTREFLLLAFAAAFNMSAIMLVIGSAPAVVLDHWHLRETQFAWLFLPLITGMMTGAILSGRAAGRMRPRRQVQLGFAVAIAATGTSAALHALSPAPPIVAQQGLLFMLGTGVQLTFPLLMLRMLDLFPHVRGSASSVQSFIGLMTSSVMMGAVVPLLQHSLARLTAASFVGSLLALFLWTRACHLGSVDQIHDDAVGPPEL